MKEHNALTCAGANSGLSEKYSSEKHGGAIVEGTAESVSDKAYSTELTGHDNSAASTKLLDASTRAKVYESTVKERLHLSYAGTIELGIAHLGNAKLLAGSGTTSYEGTGNITCALSMGDLAEETCIVKSTSKISGSCKGGTEAALRLIRGRIRTNSTKSVN